MARSGSWKGRAVLAAALLLGIAGCSGREESREGSSSAPADISAEKTFPKAEVRREFVILRELTKQHALQSESGNAARLEAVERHLRDRLENLPDPGQSDEERAILARARELSAKMAAQESQKSNELSKQP